MIGTILVVLIVVVAAFIGFNRNKLTCIADANRAAARFTANLSDSGTDDVVSKKEAQSAYLSSCYLEKGITP